MIRTRNYYINRQVTYEYFKSLNDLIIAIKNNLDLFKEKIFLYDYNYNQPMHELIIHLPIEQITEQIKQENKKLAEEINNLFGDYQKNIVIDIKKTFDKKFILQHAWCIHSPRINNFF